MFKDTRQDPTAQDARETRGVNLALPFAFELGDGRVSRDVGVTTDGRLAWGRKGYSKHTQDGLPLGGENPGDVLTLCVLWGDWKMSAQSVVWHRPLVENGATNAYLICWQDMRLGSVANATTASFQVELYPSGDAKFLYGPGCAGLGTAGAQAGTNSFMLFHGDAFATQARRSCGIRKAWPLGVATMFSGKKRKMKPRSGL